MIKAATIKVRAIPFFFLKPNVRKYSNLLADHGFRGIFASEPSSESQRDICTRSTQLLLHKRQRTLTLSALLSNPQKSFLELNIIGHSKAKLFLNTVLSFLIILKHFT